MTSTATSAPPLPGATAWALGSGTVLQGLNSAVIAVALVPIAEHYGSSAAIPWLVSSLYIASAVGSPTAGRLADLFGPRRVYLVGLLVIVIASLLGPFAPSVGWLVADRVLLGLGTSVQFPAAMAIIRREADRRASGASGAIGVVALCGQTSAALSPTVGGLVVVAAGWQGIFWINLPLVANCAFWVLRWVPADPPRPAHRPGGLDLPGVALFTLALGLAMLALLSAQDGVSGPTIAAVAACCVLFWCFVRHERRTDTAFLDLRLLADQPAILRTCGRGTVTFVAFYTVFYGVPQWLEVGRGLSPAQAGLLMFPVFGVGVLSTALAARSAARIGPRRLLVIGNAGFVLAGAVLATVAGPTSPLIVLAVANALLGVPTGFNNLGNQLTLHDACPARAAGSANGLYRTAQYIGAALSTVLVAHVVPAQAAAGADRTGSAIRDVGLCLVVIGLVLLAAGLPRRARVTGRPG